MICETLKQISHTSAPLYAFGKEEIRHGYIGHINVNLTYFKGEFI